jgi:dolichyl-phosphate beta-glucosyltransferase
MTTDGQNLTSGEEASKSGAAPELTVVIPAYNEERRLSATLESIRAYFATRHYQIIVVDDGSSDATAEQARRFAGVEVLRLDKRQGKGAAVRHGMMAAGGERILFCDADRSTAITFLRSLEAAMVENGADVAIASRGLKASKILVSQPIYRVWLGKVFNLIVQAALLPGIWDTQCGFKLFSRRAARDIFARAKLDGYSFDVEALYLARKLGYRIVELPVAWRNDPDSRVKVYRDSLQMLRDLWRIRRLHRVVRPSVHWDPGASEASADSIGEAPQTR